MIKIQLIGSKNMWNSWNNQIYTHSAKTEIRVGMDGLPCITLDEWMDGCL